MIDAATVQRFAACPAAFRDSLTIPSGRGRLLFGDCQADFQRERFASLDPQLIALAAGEIPPITRHWWEATKGASKDTDLSLAVLWLLMFTRRPVLCIVGAADQDQADELRLAAKGILHCNPWLQGEIEIQTSAIICRRTDSVCEIVAADVAGSHGGRPDLLILNELTHIQKREFAENLADNAAKIPSNLMIVATNAGILESWQWQWRELARTSPRWSFHRFDRPAPWLDPEEMTEAQRRNSRSRYLRLWEGVWVANDGDCLDDADLDASLTQIGAMYGAQPGFSFVAGLDLAVRRDHAGFCVLAADQPQQRVRLAFLKEWAPVAGRDIDLIEVRETIRDAHKRFGLAGLFFDPTEAQLMRQELDREGLGLNMIEVSQSGKPSVIQATALLEAFRSHRVDLYPDPRLLRDLKKLRLIEKSYGLRLDAVRDEHGHADLAKAFSFCLPAALELSQAPPLPCLPEFEYFYV
jgi:hypothetical protein